MDKKGIKILIVEDDEDDVVLIKDFIHSGMKGVVCTIDHATSFFQAESYIENNCYDICLLDYRLGEVDGLEFLRTVKTKEVTTPIIFLTGQGDEEVAIAAMKAGATDYLLKAKLSPELLCQSIRYAVELHKKEELRRQAEEQVRKLLCAIEQSPIIVMITDTDGNIEYVNPKFTQVTGLTAEEVIGTNMRELGGQSPEEYKRMWDAIICGGEWRGEFHNKKSTGESYWELVSVSPVRNEEGVITYFIVVKEDITKCKRAEEMIKQMAYYDSLTGLPNRVLFNDRLALALAQAHRNQQMLAIMFLDLDHFKTINDTLGHPIGDRLLQGVAQRLTSCIRESDTVARLGGDEFMLLLPGIVQADDVVKVAQRILENLKSPFYFDGHELHISTSIGIVLYPNDGGDAKTLLKNADSAMYHAKEQGRNSYQFYTSTMNEKAFERLTLENNLRRALEREEFIVYYQPQVSLKTGQIVGMEALVRWQHPEWGLVAPIKFIPLSEETGLIIPLGEWVLHKACLQNKAWQDAGFLSLRVAVNLSTRFFKRKDLIEMVARILEETKLDPNYLELEVTEGAIMENVEITIKTLRELKEMGVSLSIDDFGTGYSSLSYLKRFPIDTLKIDRSFVQDIVKDPDGTAITTAIIAMGHSLKLKVIAEGVETEEQLAFLYSNQCDEIQGYLFSKPVPAKAFTQLLQEGRCLNIGKREGHKKMEWFIDERKS